MVDWLIDGVGDGPSTYCLEEEKVEVLKENQSEALTLRCPVT